jgi:hypothetical protein
MDVLVKCYKLRSKMLVKSFRFPSAWQVLLRICKSQIEFWEKCEAGEIPEFKGVSKKQLEGAKR